MKNRMISWLLLLVVLLTALPVHAAAYEIPDVDRDDCSIDVVLWDKKKDKGIVGAELVCYRIGYVDSDVKGHYHFYDIITDTVISEGDINDSETPEDFVKRVEKGEYKEIHKYKETFEKEGVYYFTDLPTGLYLVMQTKEASGYNDMNPFLVSVPYMEDGEYVYEVTAKVKTELEQEIKPTNPPKKPTSKPTYGTKLPQTGQLTWPIPWLASGGMTLFALGWWLCFGRRKDSYEN